MSRSRSYLAGNSAASIPLLTASLLAAGYETPTVTPGIRVSDIGRAAPDILVLDIDEAETDPFELLRRMRFVLPACIIAVYSATMRRAWARSCHLAGANCLVAKSSDGPRLVTGLKAAFATGCYTDPRFSHAARAPERPHS